VKRLFVAMKKFGPGRPRIAFALIVVAKVDLHALGLAFDDQHGRDPRPSRRLGWRFPDHDICAGASAARDHPHFLAHLLKGIAVVLAQVADEFLPHQFLRFTRAVAPFPLER
jgi:hypothetical protein